MSKDRLRINEVHTQCPHCGRGNDAHTNGQDEVPSPGDVSVCWTCRLPAIFDDDMKLRLPTPEEKAEIMPMVAQMLAAAAMAGARDPLEAARAATGGRD